MSITTYELTYTVLLRPAPEGGFTVSCPSLPGVVTYGRTLGEARAMAGEAIECYLESLRKHGGQLPESDPPAGAWMEQVRVALPFG